MWGPDVPSLLCLPKELRSWSSDAYPAGQRFPVQPDDSPFMQCAKVYMQIYRLQSGPVLGKQKGGHEYFRLTAEFAKLVCILSPVQKVAFYGRLHCNPR